jgi:L-amino acid N-acyltransferase YncA
MPNYPKNLTLKSGEIITIRLMWKDDEPKLLKFFKDIPEDDRRVLRHDTTDPAVIRRWTSELDYERVFPVVAEFDDEIIGSATLHMNAYGWQRHIGELRCVVAKAYRGKGVGKLLIHELMAKATGRGLHHIQLSLVDTQTSQIRIFEQLGFRKVAVLPKYVLGVAGDEHDLVIMTSQVSDIWKRMEDLIQESEIDTIRSIQ